MSIGKTNSIGGSYQKKTITPYNFVKNVLPDANYNALSEVEIDGVLVDPHIPIESVQDNTTKYQKVIPNNVLTYGGLSKLGGMSYKFNQLFKYKDNFTTYTLNGITVTKSGNQIIISGTASEETAMNFLEIGLQDAYFVVKEQHKYLYQFTNNNITGVAFGIQGYGYTFSKTDMATLRMSGGDWDNGALQMKIDNGSTVNFSFYPQAIDLTDMYGAGNEPTSVDDFLNDYPIFRGYVPYTTGTLDYAYTKKVDITGFNIWDEEWEVGAFDTITGDNIWANGIRSKNLIRVTPNTIYYAKSPSGSNVWAMFYDKDNNVIELPVAPNYSNNVMRLDLNNERLSPANAIYMKFYVTDYGTTYNNDICINVSNNTLNGTYKPSYHNALLEAKIIAIKQKLVSLGYSADVLGYGLNNVYNYIDLENSKVVLKMSGVDLGSLTYNAYGNDTYYAPLPNVRVNALNVVCQNYIYTSVGVSSMTDLTFKVDAGSGTNIWVKDTSGTISGYCIYELATPVEIDVSDILDNDDVIGLLESGGTITFENDEKYNLPSSVTYLVEVE